MTRKIKSDLSAKVVRMDNEAEQFEVETNAITNPIQPNLAKAFVAAQGEIQAAIADSTNPHFRSKYADLSSLLVTCKPVLAKHKLAVIQSPCDAEGGRVGLSTIIMHESGEMLRLEPFSSPITKQDPQGVGSAITYMRRYALKAALAIPEEDDDANIASAPPEPAAVVSDIWGKDKTCPKCGKPAIIKGKAEYGGGWLCYKAKGGCGAKFATEPAASSQPEVIPEPSEPPREELFDVSQATEDVSVKIMTLLNGAKTQDQLKKLATKLKPMIEAAPGPVKDWARKTYATKLADLPEKAP